MNLRRIRNLLSILALVIFAAMIWGWLGKSLTDKDSLSRISPVSTDSNPPVRKSTPNFIPQIVEQPESTVKDRQSPLMKLSPEALAYADNERVALEKGPGKNPYITDAQIQESKQLQSAVEATKNPGKYSSRLSPLVRAEAFDKIRFKTDKAYREGYLSTAEPSRVYQVDDSSEYTIKRKSPYYQEVMQGESVTITVEAEPGMPVSLTSFDLAPLANHLTFQTVVADSAGSATFEIFGKEGVFNDSSFLCSAPTCRGQLKFIVNTIIKK